MFVTLNTARATARAALIRAGHTTPVQTAPASPEWPAAPSGLLNS
jgi:hypothetical protein